MLILLREIYALQATRSVSRSNSNLAAGSSDSTREGVSNSGRVSLGKVMARPDLRALRQPVRPRGRGRDELRLHRGVRGHERPALPAGALLRPVAGAVLSAGSKPAGSESL